ncbi:hypothetical protein ACH5RR_015687 [Cinchona calisaya]|uniref:Uncharacterized protein n=1 Tax=Cinchona calisaya TaxID=153742 RepID=A0ABD2ZU81_9GENT
MRANVVENREATMALFFCGLNREITNIVELHHYIELQDMVEKAIKVKRQLKSEGKFRVEYTSNWPKNWSNNPPHPNPTQNRPTNPKTNESEYKPIKHYMDSLVKSSSSNTLKHTRDIKYYRCLGAGHNVNDCPNKRALFMQGNEVESEGRKDEDDSMLTLKGPSDKDEKKEDFSQIPALVILRALHT